MGLLIRCEEILAQDRAVPYDYWKYYTDLKKSCKTQLEFNLKMSEIRRKLVFENNDNNKNW